MALNPRAARAYFTRRNGSRLQLGLLTHLAGPLTLRRVEYRLATHVGSGLVRFTLEDHRLVVEHDKSGRREELAFADVRTVNLRQEMQGACTMRIVPEKGKTIIVPARHFEGLGRFEDRGSEYVAFVRRFHELVHEHSPDARFVAGSSILYWLGWFFLAFGALFVVFLAYALFFGPKAPPRVLFAIAPVTLLVGGGFVKQGGTKHYTPDALPQKQLPANT